MLRLFSVLLSCLLLAACKPKQTIAYQAVADRFQEGKNVTWNDGTTVVVGKVEGNLLRNVRIVRKAPDGKTEEIQAEKGVITEDLARGVVVVEFSSIRIKRQDMPPIASDKMSMEFQRTVGPR